MRAVQTAGRKQLAADLMSEKKDAVVRVFQTVRHLVPGQTVRLAESLMNSEALDRELHIDTTHKRRFVEMTEKGLQDLALSFLTMINTKMSGTPLSPLDRQISIMRSLERIGSLDDRSLDRLAEIWVMETKGLRELKWA